MTGYTVHTGSTEKFAEGWDQIFKTPARKTPAKAKKATAKKKPPASTRGATGRKTRKSR
jgi:hypothetical protein